MNRKWKKTVAKLSNFQYVVSSDLGFVSQTSPPPTTFPPYDWSFLNSEAEAPSANLTYNDFVTAHAAKESIALKLKFKKRVPWQSPKVEEKRSLKIKSSIKYLTPLKIISYYSVSDLMNLKIPMQTNKLIHNKVQAFREATANKQSALAWKTVSDILKELLQINLIQTR